MSGSYQVCVVLQQSALHFVLQIDEWIKPLGNFGHTLNHETISGHCSTWRKGYLAHGAHHHLFDQLLAKVDGFVVDVVNAGDGLDLGDLVCRHIRNL